MISRKGESLKGFMIMLKLATPCMWSGRPQEMIRQLSRPSSTLDVLQQSNRVMMTAGIAISATYNETLPLWQYHRDNGAGHECTHFCVPSAPQVRLSGQLSHRSNVIPQTR